MTRGNADLGVAWKKISKDDKPYLSVRLDAPSFGAAINCGLFEIDGAHALP